MLPLSPRLPLITETRRTALTLELTNAVFPIGPAIPLPLTRHVLEAEKMNPLEATLIRLLLKPGVQTLHLMDLTTLRGADPFGSTQAPATCGTGRRVQDLW